MYSSKTYDDRELLTLVSKGNEEAFAQLFHKYRSPLFDYAFKLTKTVSASEELVQDLFLKLWTGREHLLEIQNPEAYLYRMAKNAGIDYLRKLSSNRKLQQQVLSAMQFEEHSTQEAVQLSETRRLLSFAVQQLSSAQREVFYLSRYKGMSYEQIAARLGIARNTVKNHLTASLKVIREYLVRHYDPVVVLILTAYLENNR